MRLTHPLPSHSQLHVVHSGHLGFVSRAAELAPVIGAFLASA